jgi:hypothetical protein
VRITFAGPRACVQKSLSVIPKLLGARSTPYRIARLFTRLSGPLAIQPVLLHGDLWSGNMGVEASSGNPIIFDPASYFGHNEAEYAPPIALFISLIQILESAWRLPEYLAVYHRAFSRHTTNTYPRQNLWNNMNSEGICINFFIT